MRVQHNIAAMNSYRNYGNNTKTINKNLEKLSSGYKINRAGDDAAGLAISEKMRAQITGLETAQKNAKDGVSLVQTAEGALTEVHSMLNRMYKLAEQSANGTYDTTTDRAQLQKEVNALADEIDRIATNSNFNGMYLFTGTYDTTASGTALQLQIGDSASETLSISIKDLTASGTNSANALSVGSTATNNVISIATQTAANAALTTLKTAINTVSDVRGSLGALQNRLEHTINNLSVMQENMQDAESTIRDTDVADEMMKYTKNSILVQSAQAMLAQANQQPQGVLQLLQ
jgi:flagellin